MVPARSDKVSRVSSYSGYCLVLSTFTYTAFTFSGRSFQDLSVSRLESIIQSEPRKASSPVWALPRSLAATYGITFVFSSSGYLDVSVHRVPGLNLWIQLRSTRYFLVRLPHSDICGSWSICLSPQLFAAYHVFHRLLVPRHPPCALHNLTSYVGISPDLSIILDSLLIYNTAICYSQCPFLTKWFWWINSSFWCLDFGLDIEHILIIGMIGYFLYFSIRFSRNNMR